MGVEALRDSIRDEIARIINPSFEVLERTTDFVPTLEDSSITYPNLDTQEMKCREIATCVLHVDMRSSTKITLSHRHVTLAKLYSAFVRCMARCACEYGGEVRGIVGDRLMVVFPSDGCFSAAVNTAVLMHSVTKYILNPAFPHDCVSCGIGIDHGRMSVIKAGIVKQGVANAEYKSLIWIGRPANIASKLTDAANKPLKPPHPPVPVGTVPRAPAILMSEAVWKGYSSYRLSDARWQFGKWSSFARSVEGFAGKAFGGNVVERSFLPAQPPVRPVIRRASS